LQPNNAERNFGGRLPLFGARQICLVAEALRFRAVERWRDERKLARFFVQRSRRVVQEVNAPNSGSLVRGEGAAADYTPAGATAEYFHSKW